MSSPPVHGEFGIGHGQVDLANSLFSDDARRTAMIMLNYAAMLRTAKDEPTRLSAAGVKHDAQIIDVKEPEAAHQKP
jgi:hypothetical protein